MTTHPSLGDTLALASVAHAGQPYGDLPYISHPLAVANLLLPLVVGTGPLPIDALHAALLHDTVEDTALTLADLDDFGYSDLVVTTVDAVTHRAGETYAQFVVRAATHPVGRFVKFADNVHNTSTLPADDYRWPKYNKARAVLAAAGAYL